MVQIGPKLIQIASLKNGLHPFNTRRDLGQRHHSAARQPGQNCANPGLDQIALTQKAQPERDTSPHQPMTFRQDCAPPAKEHHAALCRRQNRVKHPTRRRLCKALDALADAGMDLISALPFGIQIGADCDKEVRQPKIAGPVIGAERHCHIAGLWVQQAVQSRIPHRGSRKPIDRLRSIAQDRHPTSGRQKIKKGPHQCQPVAPQILRFVNHHMGNARKKSGHSRGRIAQHL
ncbi:MAG: hypothetical protein V4712_08420 [Pseudomonadota bacterium]